jgi:hypothetical protein
VKIIRGFRENLLFEIRFDFRALVNPDYRRTVSTQYSMKRVLESLILLFCLSLSPEIRRDVDPTEATDEMSGKWSGRNRFVDVNHPQ